MRQFLPKLIASLVLATSLVACSGDATAPNRFIVSQYDTAEWHGTLNIVPFTDTSSLKIGQWYWASATVSSTTGNIDAAKVGGFKYTVDKPNFVVVEAFNPPLPTTTDGGVMIARGFVLHAVGGAGQVVTVTIWPEADPRLKKKFFVTPYQVQ